MATLVLGAVGNAVAPGIGGFIGAALGSIIDSYFIIPALFPKDNIQGARLNDLSLQLVSEGSPMKVVIGSRVRLAGTIIWKSDLIEVKKTKKVGGDSSPGGQKVDNYSYFVDVAIGIADATDIQLSRILKVWADTKVIYDGQPDTGMYESITFYKGNQGVADPTIQSYEGVDKTPVFKKTAYVVIKRLALADFGNRIPNLTFLMEQSPDVSLGDAISLLLDRAGLAPDEYDTTRLNQCFKGMVITGPQTTEQVLSQILVAYGVGMQEKDGQFLFVTRGAEYPVDLDINDFAAHESDSDTHRPFSTKDTNGYDLPTEVNVRFMNSENDYQQGSERQRKIMNVVGDDTLTTDLPMTFTSEEARQIARRLLWVPHAERQTVSLSLPPSYLHLTEVDFVRFTYGGKQYHVIISQIERGADYMLNVQGRITVPQIYTQYGVDTPYDPLETDLGAIRETTLAVMDLPALAPDHVTQMGAYYAVCNTDPALMWVGAEIWGTPGSTYQLLHSMDIEATIGTTLTSLGAGPTLVWDEVNTLEVELLSGSLTSASEADVLEGINRAAVRTPSGEWEIIGWQTVEVIGSRKYRLSNLLRGQRGTEHLVATHNMPDQLFVLLQFDDSIVFKNQGTTVFGATYNYKAPAVGGLLDDYDPTTITHKGITMRPFSPVNLTAVRETDDDIFISWDRRSKQPAGVFSISATLPYDENPETYEIDVVDGRGTQGNVLRTVRVSSRYWTYDYASQSEDGIIPGDGIRLVFRVYQISGVAGRGVAAEFQYVS